MTLLAVQPRMVLISATAKAAAADTYRQLNLFGDVFERVRADYVEKPDDAKLIETAINGMLAGLDPHSSYMDAKSFRDMQVQTRGEFGGLGIEVSSEDGLVKVVAPIDDTPAQRAGIAAGDYIVAIDGISIQSLPLGDAVEKMRGPENSKVTLTIARTGEKVPFEITLTRAVIRVQSVKFEAKGDIGYIRIGQFNERTADGVNNAMLVAPTAQDELDEQVGFPHGAWKTVTPCSRSRWCAALSNTRPSSAASPTNGDFYAVASG